jgi:hypothetical protein
MAANDIPRAVCAVVGDVVGSHYFHHATIENLLMEAGAPGDVPEGSCVKKTVAWLKRSSEDPSCNGLRVLGRVLEEFMEVEPALQGDIWRERRARVEKILGEYALTYVQGGHVVAVGASIQTRSLESLLHARDLPALQVEFKRALEAAASDPPQAITAACSLLESLFKVYIEDEGLEMPSTQTVKPLWTVVQKSLALDPSRVEDEDIRKILSGMTSLVDGIGGLRTHAGSAHGRGRRAYAVHERHAMLVVNAASTLATFVLQTWLARKHGTPS